MQKDGIRHADRAIRLKKVRYVLHDPHTTDFPWNLRDWWERRMAARFAHDRQAELVAEYFRRLRHAGP